MKETKKSDTASKSRILALPLAAIEYCAVVQFVSGYYRRSANTVIEEIKRSIEVEEAQQVHRAKLSEKVAEQVLMLATDPDEKVREPILRALAKIWRFFFFEGEAKMLTNLIY